TVSAAKPAYNVGAAAALSFGKKAKAKPAGSSASEAAPKKAWMLSVDSDDEAELEDQDELLEEEDLAKPDAASLARPDGAAPKRKACKNCTCGLAEGNMADDDEEGSDACKPAAADKPRRQTRPVDVVNVKSACGNCSLGDAFRCTSCPYLGQPAFKPGEKVLCSLDLSRPRYNLTGLGVTHRFEADTLPSFVVRDAEAHEAKLVAPGTKGVYEDMLSRIGVQHANLGVEADKELDAQAFEEFYDKTVDLADLCQLADVNERLNQVANSYQEFSMRKEELSSELKRLAVIPRIKQRLAKLPQMARELEEATAQRQAMEAEAEEHLSSLDTMEKDISYLRMEHSMEQESEEQALAQLRAKKDELARLSAELEAKRRLLDARKDAYRKRRPLTAAEHSERMLGELARARGAAVQDDA
ncbi:Anamorsin, partial [Coemansia sp. RSA 25]